MKFHIGEKIQVGMRIGTISDIGTVLIQFKTNDGCRRIACPWDVVKISSPPQRSAPKVDPTATRCASCL